MGIIKNDIDLDMPQGLFSYNWPGESAGPVRQTSEHPGTGFGFWTWRLGSNQVNFDDYCAEILGYQGSRTRSLASGEWFATIHDEDVARVRNILGRCLSVDRSTFSYECRIKGEGGRWIRVLDRGSRLGGGVADQSLEFSVLRIVLPAGESFPPESAGGPMPAPLSCSAERMQRLSATVGHDLNNFLMVIQSQAQLMRLRTPSASTQHENLDAIEKSVQQARRLTSRLLEAARAEAGKHAIAKAELDLDEVAAEAFALYRPLIPADIRLAFRSKGAPLPVLASEEDVHQIVCNLLVNARDAVAAVRPTDQKQILMTLDVVREDGAGCHEQLWPLAAGEYAALTVRDTGTGIAEKDRNKIFSPFYSTKEQGKGTGMGLTIVLDILKRIKGGMALKTEPGKGAAFMVFLPLRAE